MAAFIIFELIQQQNAQRSLQRQRVFRDRTQVLDSLDDQNLLSRYRFPRYIILQLTDLVRDDVQRPTLRSHPVPAHIQVLVTLRYLAKGDFLSEVSDLHGISRSSSCRVINAVVSSINKNLNNIDFPLSDADKRRTKQGFYQIARFPNVLGAIDGTLIPIIAPIQDESIYVCRKGFHAINVQAVVNADLRFTNFVCKWPGSVHDSFMLKNSGLYDHMEINGNGWLIGDSGYPLRPWLMTPFIKPRTVAEERYNDAHSKTRITVERAFGVCKSRFGCIHKTGGLLPFQPPKCVKIITSVFKLHNLAIDENIPMDYDIDDNEENDNDVVFNGLVNESGNIIRQRLLVRF